MCICDVCVHELFMMACVCGVCVCDVICVCVFLGLHNLEFLNFLDAEAKFSYISSVLSVFPPPF